MAKEVDIELKKAFEELQEKMVDTTQKIKLADIQIDSSKKSIIHAQITQNELKDLNAESTRLYEGVGRMFILKDVCEIQGNLDNKIKSFEDKIKTMEANKQYLERNLKDSENNLREMIISRKGATST